MTQSVRERVGWGLAFLWWRLFRRRNTAGGARAIILDNEGRVLLVRPRYSDQWMLPGGEIRQNETGEAAVRREVREETGVVVGLELTLLGRYQHQMFGDTEQLEVYIGKLLQAEERPWSLEIRAASFFFLEGLPGKVYPSSRRRLEEYCSGDWGTFSIW